MSKKVFRNIPSVSELLETPPLKSLVAKVSHNVVVSEVRSFLEELRQEVSSRAEDIEIPLPSPSEIADRIASWIAKDQQPRLRPVINATGVLLHTGLGRAPLANAAVEALAAVAGNYASLEVDPESGHRSQRVQAVEKLICELTGAEAAAVVNNNAGATLLTLASLAAGREVIVSRGELIEIGGSYRLPEVMAAGGAVLREVGTTNKTRLSDYEDACGENTAALLRVHTSNYRIVGFTERPGLDQLVRVARKHDVLLIDDIGSGALFDFAKYNLADEPVARDSLQTGADLVLFSGDKLLGGPQCGIIAGGRKTVERVVQHPLMRALRVDKLTLAALTATLQLHRDVKQAEESLPLLRLLATSVENLQNRAERLAPQLAEAPVVADATAEKGQAQLGGGTLPSQDIPTWCVAITPHKLSVNQLTRALRLGTPPVYGRVQHNRLVLNLRTVMPSQDVRLVEALQAVIAEPELPRGD